MIEVHTEAPHTASAWCHLAGWYRAATLAERAASLQGAAPQAERGNWASEKYVVSDPIFDEEELDEPRRKTIVLDLDEKNDNER